MEAFGEEFYTRRLPGGLEAWIWRKKDFQNRHATLATRFGAMDASFEVDGRVFEVPDGTAHFLEHMAFETEKGSALGLFSRLGVRGNAFTSHTVTAYYFSGTDNFWPALRQLVELVVTSRLTPKGVENEKRVISQEIRMYDDSPEAQVLENLLQGLFARHPIRRRVAGTLESVASITPDILLRCHAAFYHPSNLVFIAAGDLDPDRVFDTVAADLERLGTTKPTPGFRRLFPEEPPLPARPRVTATMPVKRPSILVGFKDRPAGAPTTDDTPTPEGAPAPAQVPAAKPNEPDSRALFRREIACNLLVEALFGPASDLYDSLYRDGLIDDSFSARYTSDRTFGYAVAGGTTRDADLLSERLLEGISRRRQKGISEPELQRKRRKAHGQFAGLFDSLEGMATLFLTYRIKGVDLLSYPDALDAVGLEEVNEALRELFTPERVSISTIAPG